MSREGWYRRVVPVTTLVVAVLAAVAILVPGVRDQLALSATHQRQEYVALAFPRTQAGTVITCAQLPGGPGAGVRVGFDVTSHLEGARDLAYVLTLGDRRHTGTVTTDPGDTTRIVRTLAPPRGRTWPVTVVLPGVDREIHAHCTPGRPSRSGPSRSGPSRSGPSRSGPSRSGGGAS